MTGIEHDRLMCARPREEDRAFDRAIRPKRLEDYIGQPAVRQQMDIFITAARNRGEEPDEFAGREHRQPRSGRPGLTAASRRAHPP